MLRHTLTALPALLLAGALATAQGQARAELHTRSEGGIVRAVIQIELQGAWHLYHQELGHPKAIGRPTTVTFEGEGIEWGAVRFPEPIRLDQSDIGGPGAFILAHEHGLVLYAAGKLEPGASEDGLRVTLKGLVCEDIQGCIPYRQTLKTKGRGDDALFADFPADLLPEAEESSEPELDAPFGFGQDDHAQARLFTRVEGEEVHAAIRIEIDEDWHLYHTAEDLGNNPTGKPTRVELIGTDAEWEAAVFPEPERQDQSEFGGPGAYINAHEGTIVVYVSGRLGADADTSALEASIDGQTCDPNYCVNWSALVSTEGAGPDEVWSGWEAAFTEGGSDGSALVTFEVKKKEGGLLFFLLAAVAGGLFALVMPCTYPMIPITISFFTKQAEKRGGNVLPLSLAYGAGIVAIFVLVGVVFGSLVKPFASHPVTNIVLGVAFIYFALVLFGVLSMEPPRFLMKVAGTASTKGGFVGVFLMGATLVVTSFTCTAPFVGSLLSIGAAGGSALRVAGGMAVFGLTMAIPFVFLSLLPGRVKAMPRSGEWMNTVKVTLGFIELAAAFKFISNADLVLGWGWLSRELFLALWVGIFGVAALFLLGLIPLKGPQPGVSPGRMVAGLGFAMFALYCWNGTSGSSMDPVMTAIIPNYTNRPVAGGGEGKREHSIVVDDYDLARSQASAADKLLLVNFTGYT